MSERVRMVVEELDGGGCRADLARRYGVSRKTLYKWLNRYREGSWEALADRSRAPKAHPNALGAELVDAILELKRRRPFWGAPKLRQKLLERYGKAPAESTVSAVLKRHGLCRPAPRRGGATPSAQPLAHARGPNEVWSIDLKGDFLLGDGARCFPLTVCDAFSRYFLGIQGYVGFPRGEQVRQAMTALFREFGLPSAIRSDNGTPFASSGLGGLSRLSVWWVRLGIGLERIEPAHPEQNGRHERAHRTLKAQTAAPPLENLAAQQRAFDQFAREFNCERPHEALGQQPPAAFYQPSKRPFPERLPEPMGYPADWPRRLVSSCGRIKWNGSLLQVNLALSGEQIGLKPVADGLWALCFERLELGLLDERQKKIKPAPRLFDPASAAAEDYAI
jgi:putative transposase